MDLDQCMKDPLLNHTLSLMALVRLLEDKGVFTDTEFVTYLNTVFKDYLHPYIMREDRRNGKKTSTNRESKIEIT